MSVKRSIEPIVRPDLVFSGIEVGVIMRVVIVYEFVAEVGSEVEGTVGPCVDDEAWVCHRGTPP